MTQGERPEIGAILCADWSKDVRKRAVYAADVGRRLVYRLNSGAGWSVGAVLEQAKRWLSSGPVLVAFDAPLGVPESYLAVAAPVLGLGENVGFLDFLRQACLLPGFFTPTAAAKEWRVERPFFPVPAGRGGLTSYKNSAEAQGVDLWRKIDKTTKAKTAFATSGIPGSVGCAACSLWCEIGILLRNNPSFRVWPFEGDFETLLQAGTITIGETYPRAAYATALIEGPVKSRAPLSLAKTNAGVRAAAVEALAGSEWVRAQGVRIEGLDEARGNEDDFDACVTAAALLRCELEGLRFFSPGATDRIEGGILGSGSMNLALPERPWRVSLRDGRSAKVVAHRPDTSTFLRCPIAGCSKGYANVRSGWDSHVGSLRTHPWWHPELVPAKERKARFVAEFPDFFERRIEPAGTMSSEILEVGRTK